MTKLFFEFASLVLLIATIVYYATPGLLFYLLVFHIHLVKGIIYYKICNQTPHKPDMELPLGVKY